MLVCWPIDIMVYSSKKRWSMHVEYNWFVLACVSDVLLYKNVKELQIQF